MFADPQSLTYNTVAKSLVRVSTGETSSVYRTADGEFQLRISHQESKGRIRHLIRIDRTIVAADPLTAVNAYAFTGMYFVVDEPKYGFTDADHELLRAAFIAVINTANVAKLMAGEH